MKETLKQIAEKYKCISCNGEMSRHPLYSINKRHFSCTFICKDCFKSYVYDSTIKRVEKISEGKCTVLENILDHSGKNSLGEMQRFYFSKEENAYIAVTSPDSFTTYYIILE